MKKYGEINTIEKLNEKAAALLNAKDNNEIIALAKENGIDKEDAQDYIDGFTDEFATIGMAALGRLKVSADELKIDGILKDWVGYINQMVIEDKEMAAAVLRKSLEGCMSKLIKFAFENKVQVSNKIVDITKVKVNGKTEQLRKPIYLGIPNALEAKNIIKEYYKEAGK